MRAAREERSVVRRVLDDRLTVVGAALVGAAVGAAGLEILRRAEEAESRVCEKDPLQGCLTLYPLMGIAGWIAVALAGFVILLWALRVRPLAGAVAACTALSLCTMMLWAEVGGLARSWLFYLMSTAGPALVVALRSPRMRRPASVVLVALLAPLLLWMGWRSLA
ncbi:hypothetical protein [Streptomyces sp. NPDC053079]|uniref:hypothetical protein n=1 Tax=Streptomyces sp. NPDC053079 TaxID=3365697 RepID=UPI0037D61D94